MSDQRRYDGLKSLSGGDSSNTLPDQVFESKLVEVVGGPEASRSISCPRPDQDSIFDFRFGEGYGRVEAVVIPPVSEEGQSSVRLGQSVVENFVPEYLRDIAMPKVAGRKFYEVLFVRLVGVEGSDHEMYAVLLPAKDEQAGEYSTLPVVLGVSEDGYELGEQKVSDMMDHKVNFIAYGLIKSSIREALINRIPFVRVGLRRSVNNFIDRYEGRALRFEEFRDADSIESIVSQLIEDLTDSMREDGLYSELVDRGVNIGDVQHKVSGHTKEELANELNLMQGGESLLFGNLIFPLDRQDLESLISIMRQAIQNELRGVGRTPRDISDSPIHARVMNGFRFGTAEDSLSLQTEYANLMVGFMMNLL